MNKETVVITNGKAETLTAMGAQLKFLCPGDKTGRNWSLTECTAPKDAGPPPHEHPWDEAYYILDGEVRFIADGKDMVLGAGDFIYVPGGTVHGFHGASDTPGRMLIFDAPAASESFFRELNREIKVMPDDLPKALAIGERHQIHFHM